MPPHRVQIRSLDKPSAVPKPDHGLCSISLYQLPFRADTDLSKLRKSHRGKLTFLFRVLSATSGGNTNQAIR